MTTHDFDYPTTSFDFTSTVDTAGTSNVTYLLSDDSECIELLRGFTAGDMEETFGPGLSDHYMPGKGYEESEWMFKNDAGEVVGIGYRWGQSRIRGRGLTKETAQRFIKLVRQKINIARSSQSESEVPLRAV